MPPLYRFGPFELDPGDHRLTAGERVLTLTRRTFSTLLHLVENPGRLVTRDELLSAVWKDTIVEEGNLHTTVSTIRKALAEHSTESYIETARGLGYRFVAPVERVEAEAPSHSPAPKTLPLPMVVELPPGGRRRSDHWGFRLAQTLGVLLLAVLAWLALPSRAPQLLGSSPSLAVLGFRNLGAEAADSWISTALAELLAADLSRASGLLVVPAERVAEMRRDLALPAGTQPTRSDLERMRRHLSSDWALGGSFLPLPNGGLRVNAELVSAHGEGSVRVSQTGTRADLLSLTTALVEGLRQPLGLAASPEAGSSPMPADSKARQLYAQGLDLSRRFESVEAVAAFTEATRREPGFALAWLELSKVEARQGEQRSALAAAESALELSSQLPEELRLAITAHHRKLTGQWQEAVKLYRQLSERAPGDPERAFDWAFALSQARLGPELDEALREISQRLPGTRMDARFLWLEAESAMARELYGPAIAAAQRAVALARRQGAVELETRALLRLAQAHNFLGGPNDRRAARAALDEVERLVAGLKNPYLAASTQNTRGNLLSATGQDAEAQVAYRESADIYRRMGASWLAAPSLYNLGNTSFDLGDLLAADRYFQESFQLCQVHGPPSCRSRYLNALGAVFLHRGQLDDAHRVLEESIDLHSSQGLKLRVAEAMELEATLKLYEGDLAGAEKLARETLKLREELATPRLHTMARMNLGAVLVECGKLEEAEALLRRVASEEPTGEQDISRHLAAAHLALVQLARGDREGADAASGAVFLEFPPPALPSASFAIWLIRCRVLLGLGRFAEAESLIDQGLVQAGRGGFVSFELEGKLLQVELAQTRGQLEEAQLRARDLAREARAKGFLGVAGKAEVLAGLRLG